MPTFGNKCFPICFFVQALHSPRSGDSSGKYRVNYNNVPTCRLFFSLVSFSPRTRSRPDAEKIRQGEGRLSHPSKTAVERSYMTESSCSENRILRPRRNQLLTEFIQKWIIIYLQGLRMGRAGQHFEWFDSILGRVKKVTTHNHNLRVQYVR